MKAIADTAIRRRARVYWFTMKCDFQRNILTPNTVLPQQQQVHEHHQQKTHKIPNVPRELAQPLSTVPARPCPILATLSPPLFRSVPPAKVKTLHCLKNRNFFYNFWGQTSDLSKRRGCCSNATSSGTKPLPWLSSQMPAYVAFLRCADPLDPLAREPSPGQRERVQLFSIYDPPWNIPRNPLSECLDNLETEFDESDQYS